MAGTLSQAGNSSNPFVISKLTIDGMDVTQHYVEMMIVEDIFSPFIKGSLTLSNLILSIPKNDFENPELGFLNRELEIQWNINPKKELAIENKKLTFVIYSIGEETQTHVKLSFVQKGYFNYLTKQFCDGWEDKKVIDIIKSVFEDYVFNDLKIKPKYDFVDASDIISFTNPSWTPVKAIKFLLPMIKGGYFLFRTTDNTLHCKSINDLLKQKEKYTGPEEDQIIFEDIKLFSPESSTESNLSQILNYKISKKSNNIIDQIYNNVHGSRLVQYNPFTKNLKIENINNSIQSLESLGTESILVSEYDGRELRYDFSFTGINKINSESNVSVYEFFNKNALIINMYGFTRRNVGNIVNINLTIKDRLLLKYKDEIGGKSIITSIQHLFSRSNYIQQIKVVKTALNSFKENEPSKQTI